MTTRTEFRYDNTQQRPDESLVFAVSLQNFGVFTSEPDCACHRPTVLATEMDYIEKNDNIVTDMNRFPYDEHTAGSNRRIEHKTKLTN